MIDGFAKEYLHSDLREIREVMLWKLDGLAEYDIRRPLTSTGTNLVGKVKHLTECIFYTDDWDAFAKHLPPERHVIGKAHTITIEHDNSNTRHHLGRMTRRTKVVSKKPQMVYDSIKLWLALTTPALFQQYQVAFLSIFM
jgi:insertion element IS1 protein InsB